MIIEYINLKNINNKVIKKGVDILKNGGLIAYPTDTSWGIGCSVHSKVGIEKLRKLKGDFKNYAITLICSNISQISELTELNNRNFKFIKKYTPGPFVFILKALNAIEKKINMKRVEIGVRIPDQVIPIKIVQTLGSSIFSITASKKMTDNTLWTNKYAEENLFEYSYELEDIKELSMIIDYGEPLPKVLSTVIDLTTDEIKVIRQGIGIIE